MQITNLPPVSYLSNLGRKTSFRDAVNVGHLPKTVEVQVDAQ